MIRIYEVAVSAGGGVVRMHAGARVTDVHYRNGVVVYYEAPEDAPPTDRRFGVYLTGAILSGQKATRVGHVQDVYGTVWHVYDEGVQP